MLRRFPVQGPVAATRERGREVRGQLEEFMRASQPGDVVEIDLTSVEAMTVSFADEVVGRFMVARAGGDFVDRAVVLVGASDDVRETLEAVLARRQAGAIYRDQGTGTYHALAGPIWYRQTLAEVQRLDVFKAVDLAQQLGLTPQAANNRLKQLAATGAVMRERSVPDGGGKEFEYRAATTVAVV